MIDDRPIGTALSRNLGSPSAPGQATEAELDRLIERRSRQKDPEEESALWRASERAYFARRDEERCLARLTYHEGQAARLSGALGALVAHHRAEAEKYRDRLTKGDAA